LAPFPDGGKRDLWRIFFAAVRLGSDILRITNTPFAGNNKKDFGICTGYGEAPK
jgi:hypothetical protein